MSTETLQINAAFQKRHSTRNFSTSVEWTPEKQALVEKIVAEANELPRLFGGRVEAVVAPTGFGLLNFIVNEKGWIFAKTPTDLNKEDILMCGYVLQTAVMRLTQNNIATCWIAGTYQASKAVDFCGGECKVPAVIAFGDEDSDRWLDSFVKWCGTWRGMNEFKDKFYDKKQSKAITEKDAGDRIDICTALAKIPCGMKPHSYRIVFDEPLIHVFNVSNWELSYFDMGIVMANIKLYYEEAQGKKVSFRMSGEGVESPQGGNYVVTAVIEE